MKPENPWDAVFADYQHWADDALQTMPLHELKQVYHSNGGYSSGGAVSSGASQAATTYAAADAALTADVFGTTAIKSLTTVSSSQFKPNSLANILKALDTLIDQLAAPSEEPGSEDYEDGYAACLALVEDFRNAVRRGDTL